MGWIFSRNYIILFDNMKKTFVLLLAFGSIAMGDVLTTLIPDISQSWQNSDASITWSAGDLGSLSGSGIWATGGGNRAHTGVSFTLEFDESRSGC